MPVADTGCGRPGGKLPTVRPPGRNPIENLTISVMKRATATEQQGMNRYKLMELGGIASLVFLAASYFAWATTGILSTPTLACLTLSLLSAAPILHNAPEYLASPFLRDSQ